MHGCFSSVTELGHEPQNVSHRVEMFLYIKQKTQNLHNVRNALRSYYFNCVLLSRHVRLANLKFTNRFMLKQKLLGHAYKLYIILC